MRKFLKNTSLQQYEKTKLCAGAFQEFLQIERITEGKLKCLLHTPLISNALFDENKDKRKRYSLSLKEQNGKFIVY